MNENVSMPPGKRPAKIYEDKAGNKFLFRYIERLQQYSYEPLLPVDGARSIQDPEHYGAWINAGMPGKGYETEEEIEKEREAWWDILFARLDKNDVEPISDEQRKRLDFI